jgi:signal transduction histidine kinase
LGILNILIFILSLYFVYVFIDKKSPPAKVKIALILASLPIIFLTPTQFNLNIFNIANCEAIENKYFTNYYYLFGLFIFLWIIALSIYKYKKSEGDIRKQILFLTFGIGLFLLAFFTAGYIASLTDNFNFELYGLFGMPIFIGFLAYLIVKFKAFNTKLLAIQALVISLIVIIGSQFAFIQNNTNKILTGITLALAISFGWILIRSAKKEVKQREGLELANIEIEKRNEAILERNEKLKIANREISKRKNQLQKISDSLAIANDKLKKLDTAKTEFVSMASHQLRTPPTPIKGYSSMLLEGSYGELNAEQKRAVENISAANNQQITFVEDLLAVSRIESGSMKFVFEKCQIGKLCEEVVSNLILKAKDKGLYLDYKAPVNPLPEIAIDGNKIREVISNLVDNAVKYTQRGGVTILAELCQKKEKDCLAKPHLRVTVSDTGIGVPAEEIPHLFQKFSRGKDITRLNTGGTGLGLYVVKMLTQANGGKVWIESPGAGRGSKFILELPLTQLPETLERNE